MNWASGWPGLCGILVAGIFGAGACMWQVKHLVDKVDLILDNHLPHILRELSEVKERLARIEGPRE